MTVTDYAHDNRSSGYQANDRRANGHHANGHHANGHHAENHHAENHGYASDDQGEPTGSWWRRWAQSLRTPRPDLVVRADPATPIQAPCRGHVFDFQVFGWFTWWAATELSEEEMYGWVRRFTPRARLRLQRHAVEVARRFGPQEGQQMGAELNRRLNGVVWQFTNERVSLACEVWCHISLDEAVRATLRPLWQQRIEMDEKHELDLRRAALALARTEAWSGVLEKLQDNPLSEPAAALTDPTFAEAFAQWCEERRKETNSLLELLTGGPTRGSKRMQTYEYAESFDAAVRAFRKEHGFPEEDQPGNGVGR